MLTGIILILHRDNRKIGLFLLTGVIDEVAAVNQTDSSQQVNDSIFLDQHRTHFQFLD
jgi:poly-beta-hydroxyalkanoate depolymerase